MSKEMEEKTHYDPFSLLFLTVSFLDSIFPVSSFLSFSFFFFTPFFSRFFLSSFSISEKRTSIHGNDNKKGVVPCYKTQILSEMKCKDSVEFNEQLSKESSIHATTSIDRPSTIKLDAPRRSTPDLRFDLNPYNKCMIINAISKITGQI